MARLPATFGLMDIIREPEIGMEEIHPYKSLLDAMRR
jgi:hypothetical protein